MDIHRQQCQACQSFDMRNILVRETGRPPAVFVRCVACGKLVARYELGNYYHHGKGIESWLRSRGIASVESGRDTLAEFEEIQRAAVEGYKQVLAKLEEMGKAV
jgi:RNase P subunit RPR2